MFIVKNTRTDSSIATSYKPWAAAKKIYRWSENYCDCFRRSFAPFGW